MKRIEGACEPSPDRRCTRGRKLLRTNDRSEARKAGSSPPQLWHAGFVEHGNEPRIERHQRAHSYMKIGVVMNERHRLKTASQRRAQRGREIAIAVALLADIADARPREMICDHLDAVLRQHVERLLPR